MTAMLIALLIQPADLANLQNAYPVDVRPQAAYAQGHIPGAVHVDVTAFSEDRGKVKGLLKPVDELRPLLEKAGLHPDKHIVIYGASSKSVDDLRDATRLFWILEYLGFEKVSVLEGGFERWQAEKREVQAEAVEPVPVTLPDLKPREELMATADEVAEAAKSEEAHVLDVRSQEDYAGEKKNPALSRAGHIPGAHNLPADDMVDAQDNEVDVETTGGKLEDLGWKEDDPFVTYCTTGRQASVGYFTLRLLGADNVSLYDGSMSEWSADPDRPVETGGQEPQP